MPFQKGQSGNPGGRPKLADAFREKARKAVDDHVLDAWIDEVEGVEQMVESEDGAMKVIKKRGKEWIRASELLAAYGYGKPPQPVEHGGPDGEQLAVTVHFRKPNAKQ